eukprot:GILK01001654.1.p1 GENE.GILK01001654.1~~GILK01001654.1.p1  ORF type:complete len:442 (+),score=79.64 GILK01001654.1:100-1326(+)
MAESSFPLACEYDARAPLTPAQLESLNQMHARCADILAIRDHRQQNSDDCYLLKWLRARDYNVDAAELMLRNHFAWRAEFGTDKILDEGLPIDVLSRFYPNTYHGRCKDGSLLYVERTGWIDVKSLERFSSTDQIVRWHVWMQETQKAKFAEATKREGRPIEKVTSICDMTGMTMGKMNKALYAILKSLSSIDQDNYPEQLNKLFVVNAPGIINVVWNVVKPWLNPVTKSKIDIIGGSGRDKLLAFIDADQLPDFLGGACKCSGGCLPWYGEKDGSGSFLGKYLEADVPAKKFQDFPIRIEEPNSKVNWEFISRGSNINFGVTFTPDAGAAVNVEALKSVNSAQDIIKGEFVAPSIGTVTVRFDNSDSWFKSKSVQYKLDLTAPEPSAEALAAAVEAVSVEDDHHHDA